MVAQRAVADEGGILSRDVRDWGSQPCICLEEHSRQYKMPEVCLTWRPKETAVEYELREVVAAKCCLSSLKKIILSFKAPNLPILNIRHPSWVKCQMKIYLFILLSNDSGSFIITLHSNESTTNISLISFKGFFKSLFWPLLHKIPLEKRCCHKNRWIEFSEN